MIRKLILLALATVALAAEPALAQRGHDRGGHDRGGNHDRGRDHDRGGRHGGSYYGGSYYGGGYGHRHYYRGSDAAEWVLGLSLGLTALSLLDQPDYDDPQPGYSGYSGYSQPPANAWGLTPGQCRWDREFGYWYNRPADVEVQRCADAGGSVYTVQGSHRLWRYR